MFERGLKVEEVQSVIESGEVIASYPDDQPLPSFLILGWVRERPLHGVVAVDVDKQQCQIVTSYKLALDLWSSDFKTRRMP
jgi:hypothetical protein